MVFRENGDEVVHSSSDEESPDPVARTRDEIQAAVIDELKQGRVALKHNPAYGPLQHHTVPRCRNDLLIS